MGEGPNFVPDTGELRTGESALERTRAFGLPIVRVSRVVVSMVEEDKYVERLIDVGEHEDDTAPVARVSRWTRQSSLLVEAIHHTVCYSEDLGHDTMLRMNDLRIEKGDVVSEEKGSRRKDCKHPLQVGRRRQDVHLPGMYATTRKNLASSKVDRQWSALALSGLQEIEVVIQVVNWSGECRQGNGGWC